MRRNRWWTFLLIWGLLSPGFVSGASIAPLRAAQSACLSETEPNDAPEGAPEFEGASCLTGALPDGDQDIWIWTLTPDEAEGFWTFAIDGIPDTATAVKLLPIPSVEGETPITPGEELLEVSTQPDQPSKSESRLLLLPGRYLVGIARSVTASGMPAPMVDYTVRIEREALPQLTESEPNDDAASANPVSGAFAISGDNAGSMDLFTWSLSETDAELGWALTANASIGTSFTVELRGSDSLSLLRLTADRLGRVTAHDLKLPAGDYQINVWSGGEEPSPYVIETVPQSVPTHDLEPNDLAASASAFDLSEGVVKGRLDREGDIDHYRLTVDEELAQTQFDLKLLWRSDLRRRLCIEDAMGSSLQCREGQAGIALANVLLSAGDYTFVVSGTPDLNDPYLLRLDATSSPATDFESEPNDSAANANAFQSGITMRGRLDGADDDFFKLTVSDEAQLWRLEATGSGLQKVALVTPSGLELMNGDVSGDGSKAVISDLFLIPGEHWFRIGGQDGEYTVAVTPLGPPDPNGEREPNNSTIQAEPLLIGQERIGRLVEQADVDVYRFSLAATERIVLTLEPPADGAIAMRLSIDTVTLATAHSPVIGEPLVYDALFYPGDYEIRLSPGTVSEGSYRLRLERSDPLALADDQEPNDTIAQARPIPPSLTVSGSGGPFGDPDWYLLPAAPGVTSLQITVEGDVSWLELSDGVNAIPLQLDSAGDGMSYLSDRLPGDIPFYLSVLATGDYTVSVAYAEGPAPAETSRSLPVEMTLTTDTDRVAAYWSSGQRIDGTLTLRNTSLSRQTVRLDAVTSHYAWTVELPDEEIGLGIAGVVEVPVTIRTLPDAWASIAVRVTVRAKNERGAQETAFVEMVPERDAEPVNPEQAWPVPVELLGGLDVASSALGAVVVPSIDAALEAELHDGVNPAGRGFKGSLDSGPITLTIDLAGEDPAPIAGIILNPLARGNSFIEYPRTFQLRLSEDGVTYTPALEGALAPMPIEQAFILDEPIEARFAQLVLESTYADTPSSVVLGEWEIIATPGFVPGAAPLNIADPALGGHVVWMDPQVTDQASADSMLADETTAPSMRLSVGARPEWVVGFHHNRAAQITELQWVDITSDIERGRFNQVDLEVSLTSPVGPWEPIGSWRLERAPDGSVAPFVLDQPAWARFIRFTGHGPVDTDAEWEFPSTIRMIERATDDEYRSIFGEWGDGSPVSIYELLDPPPLTIASDEADDNDRPETARRLEPGIEQHGRVHFGIDVDWYELAVPDGRDTVTFDVGGFPTVQAKLTLYDADGSEVPMTFSISEAGGLAQYVARVTPGQTYRVRVEQPTHSVVFTFDTSMSLGNYQPYVFQALRAFSASVEPGRDFVHIVPFDERPLLDTWTDEPYLLQAVLGRYVNQSLSSSAETALIDASALLAAREGTKAVLIVTDAETSSYQRSADLWTALEQVRPIVMSVQVGADSTPREARHFMQDWASVAGGYYQYTRSHGEMDRAFDRLATWLRRPAAYTLSFSVTTEVPPTPSPTPTLVASPIPEPTATSTPTSTPSPTVEPTATVTPTATMTPTPTSTVPSFGTIRLADSRTGTGGDAPAISTQIAVEIILDTSGSMLQELEPGQLRIDIAKAVLTDLVEQQLPPGMPVALRIFGNQPDSCETVLALPLQPLDPASVSAQIAGLQVINLVRTPLGFALEQVASDLAGFDGPKVVILVTDGEETCDGDPAGAIQRLVDQGVDVQVNIVGFALDDDALRETFREWARIGNGTYFDATNAEELNRAIAGAAGAPFRIYDANGNLVGSGTVGGDAVEVPAGVYTIVILTEPEVRIDQVAVGPEAQLTIDLADR